MTLREAAIQAIEAMCCMRDMVAHPDNLAFIDKHISVLQAALAESEQEPVAFCNGMPAYEGTLSKAQRTHLTQDLDAPLTLNGVALYPRRRPLTDEALYQIVRYGGYAKMEDFARLIEKAHGIGEQHE